VRNIHARVPLRLSLAGGGTDIEPFPSQFGSVTSSFAITQFIHADLSITRSNHIEIVRSDTMQSTIVTPDSTPEYSKSLEGACASILPPNLRKGLRLNFRSPVKEGSGLGASSAIAVALVGLLHRYMELPTDPITVARTAFSIERDVLSIEGGFQDQFACAFGGLNTIYKLPGAEVSVDPLKVSRNFELQIEHDFILIGLPDERKSMGLIKKQQTLNQQNDHELVTNLLQQKSLGEKMVDAIKAENISQVAQILNESWNTKKSLIEGISNPTIDKTCDHLLQAGALAVKLTGAGGGGHLLVITESSMRPNLIRQALDLGLRIVDFSISRKGLELWNT